MQVNGEMLTHKKITIKRDKGQMHISLTRMISYGIVAFAIVSCTNFQEDEVPVNFGVDTNQLDFAIAPSTRSVTVSSGTKWDVSSIPSWISLESISRSGRSPYEWIANFSAAENDEYNREGMILIKAGSEAAEISVTQEGKKGKFFAVESVSLSPTELTLTEGETASLNYTISPANASIKDVTWESSSPSVATVSSSGVVTAKAVGSTTITVTTNDGGKKASCNVNVLANSDVVDLGLSVKWATCNLGASTSSEYGDYYAWGEVSPKELSFWSDNYKWFTLMYEEEQSTPRRRYYLIKKYILESDYLDTMPDSYDDWLLYVYPDSDYPPDNKLTLDSTDDAARTKLGDGWRIPTIEEWEELMSQCDWTQTTRDGIDGYTVSSKINGNSFFIPYAGWISGSSVIDQGSYGDYWSSSRSDNRPFVAKSISFGQSRGILSREGWHRFSGLSIRPVYTK